MLQFPYLPEALTKTAPPSLPPGTKYRFRPLIPCRILAPNGLVVSYQRALLDTGSQDSLFPLDAAAIGGIALLPPTSHAVRWRGLGHPVRFGDVTLRIEAQGMVLTWNAIVGVTAGLPRYPILGSNGFLDRFNASFRSSDRIVELEPNDEFVGLIGNPA